MCYCQMITHCHKHLLFNSPKNRALECFLLFRYMRRIFALVLSRVRPKMQTNEGLYIFYYALPKKELLQSFLWILPFVFVQCIHIFSCNFPFISSYFSHFYYTKFVIQLSSVRFGTVVFCCSLLLVLVPLNNKHVRAIWLFVSRKYFWVIMCLS